MSIFENRRSRGIPLPRPGQILLAAAMLGACGVLWVEITERFGGAADERARAGSVERIQVIESLVNQGPDAAPQLIELLASADPKVRGYALYGLGRLKAEDTLPAIRERLSDEDGDVRRYALFAFGRTCEDADELIAVTAHLLADPRHETRELAAQMLDAEGTRAVPRLMEAARVPDLETRRRAIELLTRIDRRQRDPAEVNAALRRLLESVGADARLDVIGAVVSRGAANVADVRAWLPDNDPEVVNRGFLALSQLPETAAPLIPKAVALLPGSGAAASLRLRALAPLKADAGAIIPAALQAYETLPDAARIDAIDVLYELGAEPAELERRLAALLQNALPDVRNMAGRLLTRVSPGAARREAARLVAAIEAHEAAANRNDLETLVSLAGAAPEAVPLLTRLLSHPVEGVPALALRGLCEVGPAAAPALPLLISMFDSTDPRSQTYGAVIRALGAIGPAARGAVPRLVRILEEEPPQLAAIPTVGTIWPARQIDASWALGRIGEGSAGVLAALRRQTLQVERGEPFSHADTALLRQTALDSLVRLAGDSLSIENDVLPMLNDRAPIVRAQALTALVRADRDRQTAIERLADALFDVDPCVRTAAALSLREIGDAAQAAVPALRAAARDTRNLVPNTRRARWRWPKARTVSLETALERYSVAAAARAALAAIAPSDEPVAAAAGP